jgi:hypothetical protein
MNTFFSGMVIKEKSILRYKYSLPDEMEKKSCESYFHSYFFCNFAIDKQQSLIYKGTFSLPGYCYCVLKMYLFMQ